MGLFSKKKKEEKPKEFPIYETHAPDLKEPFSIPLRKPEPPLAPLTTKARGEEKPIFVKIDKYKAAISTIEDIKAKLENIEKILRNLNKIKSEEEDELENWQRDVSIIKEKLLSVDKNLFGV